jgi:hypothetical protein
MICYFGIIILERKIDTGFQGKLAFTFSMKSLIKTCIYSTCIKSFNSQSSAIGKKITSLKYNRRKNETTDLQRFYRRAMKNICSDMTYRKEDTG